MKRILFVIYIFLSAQLLYSQKEYNNWYFGAQAAITFNNYSGSPKVLQNSQMVASEGCGSISDRNGNLLFYTNGINVWNMNGQIINPGQALKGDISSAQSGLIIRQPGTTNIYYVFVMSAFGFDGLYYSTLNADYTNKSVSLVKKNIKLIQYTTEKITATYHANKRDIWIIAHEWNSDAFYSFLLTSSGLQNPIISTSGDNISTILGDRADGCMKASPDGKLLLVANAFNGSIGLFDFDNKTGKVATPRNLGVNCYGVEFSPDSKKLYATTDNTNEILQYDLNSLNTTTIKGTRITLAINGGHGALQIAPDAKIYVSDASSSYLGVISSPNEQGVLCNYNPKSVYLKPSQCSYGLPQTLTSNLFPAINLSTNAPVCEGDTLRLYAQFDTLGIDIIKFNWHGPKGFTSNDTNPIIPNFSKNDTGDYYFRLDYNGYTLENKISVTVYPRAFLKIFSDKGNSICKGDSLLLQAYSDISTSKILWSTGDTTPNIIVKKGGKYSIKVVTEYNCIDSTEFIVTEYPDVSFRITGKKNICNGDSSILSTVPVFTNCTYLWTTGGASPQTTPQITVKKGGKYFLEVKSDNNCTAIDSFTVNVGNIADFSITGDSIICNGSETILQTSRSFASYLWNTGETSPTIKADKSGIYSVNIKDSSGCEGYASFKIDIIPAITLKILGNNTICFNDSIILTADKDYNNYIWSTGASTKSIVIRSGGWYKLNVRDKNGCIGVDSIYIEDKNTNLDGINNINFGKIKIQSNKEIILNLKNISSADITISKISQLSNVNVFKVKIDKNLISTGVTANLKVDFLPLQPVFYKDTIKIEVSEPCIKTYYLEISGCGYADIFVWIPDTTAIIGTINYNIPIYAKLDAINPTSVKSSIYTGIEFEATGFSPKDVLPSEFSDKGINNSIKTIDMKLSNYIFPNNDIKLSALQGVVLLYSQPILNLHFLKSESGDSLINFIPMDGSLTYNKFCIKDLNLIIPLKLTDMEISPNPANSIITINISGQEQGLFTLSIFDFKGSKLFNELFENYSDKISTKQYIVNLKDFSDGVYLIVLTKPLGTITQMIRLVK